MSRNPCYQCGQPVKDNSQFCSFCGCAFANNLTGKLSPNALLDNRYLILRLVGQGGMGAIYQAVDTRLQGRVCAVKEMSVASLPPGERPPAIQQFEQEAAMLARLHHPHLPQVCDFFEDNGHHYLVMDFIEGQTLDQRLAAKQRPFSEQQVRLWADQLSAVLSYLHKQNPPIIFRDLKPDNIMLDQNDQIKLIDFGIARLFKPAQARDTQVIGTPGYAAPEQYGSGQTDERADVYGLGVTLLTLLTGHDPAADPFHLPLVQRLNPAVSTQMANVIQRATQIQPGHRFQSIYLQRA
jgi:serine/threonine protein kinase